MKIDKSRFLVLTTSLAAASAAALIAIPGCSTTQTSTDAGTQPANDSGGSGDVTTNDSGGGDTGTDSGPTCLGDKGPAPVCFATPVGEGDGGLDADDAGGDAGVDAKCAYECDRVSMYFKKDVAKAVNDCLDTAPTCEGGVPDCVDKALPKVCDDSTAKDFCTPLVQGCQVDGGDAATTPLTQAACEAIAKALTTEGRTAFTVCVSDEGLGCDLAGDCVDQIKQ